MNITVNNISYYIPHEIWLYIFQYADSKDLSRNMLVCKEWFNLCTQNMLWSKFYNPIEHGLVMHEDVETFTRELPYSSFWKTFLNITKKMRRLFLPSESGLTIWMKYHHYRRCRRRLSLYKQYAHHQVILNFRKRATILAIISTFFGIAIFFITLEQVSPKILSTDDDASLLVDWDPLTIYIFVRTLFSILVPEKYRSVILKWARRVIIILWILTIVVMLPDNYFMVKMRGYIRRIFTALPKFVVDSLPTSSVQ